MSYTQQYENSTDEFANDTWKDNEWGIFNHDNPNYINWITYNIRQIPKYKDCTLDFEDNNTFTTVPQENTVINENQSNTDIPAETAEYYNNIDMNAFVDKKMKYSRNPHLIRKIKSDLITEFDLYNNFTNEKSIDSTNLNNCYINNLTNEYDNSNNIINESYNLEQINKQQSTSCAENLSREVENNDDHDGEGILNDSEIIPMDADGGNSLDEKEQSNNISKRNKKELYLPLKEEPPDNMRNKKQEPPDNMRNKKKPKTHDYNYNLSLPDCNKTKSKLLNIDNEGQAFFFSYL
ncbi:MAG: hypothetical protein IJ590_04950 [Rickettsiales bacterium]|nr:hypothetical protein [Rickettsiales bacterium]